MGTIIIISIHYILGFGCLSLARGLTEEIFLYPSLARSLRLSPHYYCWLFVTFYKDSDTFIVNILDRYLLRQRKRNKKTCVIPGVGGVLPREGSAPGCAPGPPKLPLDEPFVAYSLDDLAAEACNGIKGCESI